MNRLQKEYNEKIVKDLRKDLGLENVMQTPALKKITVSAGIGPFSENKEAVSSFVDELSMITGQLPAPRRARKSESGFKIRQGDIIGYTVTLRGDKMWAFLDKFVSIVLPRVRDFKGLNPKSFDQNGNYSVGLKEHVIFPEINPNNVKAPRGLQVNFSIDNFDKNHSRVLLEKLGIPFIKG